MNVGLTLKIAPDGSLIPTGELGRDEVRRQRWQGFHREHVLKASRIPARLLSRVPRLRQHLDVIGPKFPVTLAAYNLATNSRRLVNAAKFSSCRKRGGPLIKRNGVEYPNFRRACVCIS